MSLITTDEDDDEIRRLSLLNARTINNSYKPRSQSTWLVDEQAFCRPELPNMSQDGSWKRLSSYTRKSGENVEEFRCSLYHRMGCKKKVRIIHNAYDGLFKLERNYSGEHEHILRKDRSNHAPLSVRIAIERIVSQGQKFSKIFGAVLGTCTGKRERILVRESHKNLSF